MIHQLMVIGYQEILVIRCQFQAPNNQYLPTDTYYQSTD